MARFSVRTYNKVSKLGLDRFGPDLFDVSEAESAPDALILRSHQLKVEEIPDSVKAIARAGAGVNNIPVDACTERGIVVFNTPGANANAVKELVVTGMLLASRDIVAGIEYVRGIADQGDEVKTLVEANKSKFKGCEIQGKRLAVIGLGAIGRMVANVGLDLGMQVKGYDPFISIRHAWALSSHVSPAESLKEVLLDADYVSVHIPYTAETKAFVNQETLALMKEGVVLLNFSRDALVEEGALLSALASGTIHRYVTDFPNATLVAHSRVIPLPHLGASTQEAEDNCACMATDQIKWFLDRGSIQNSVNFPACQLEQHGDNRLIIVNQNEPNMIGQFTTMMAEYGLNITEMVNKSRDSLAYNILDFAGEPSTEVVDQIRGIAGVIRTRLLQGAGSAVCL